MEEKNNDNVSLQNDIQELKEFITNLFNDDAYMPIDALENADKRKLKKIMVTTLGILCMQICELKYGQAFDGVELICNAFYKLGYANAMSEFGATLGSKMIQ